MIQLPDVWCWAWQMSLALSLPPFFIVSSPSTFVSTFSAPLKKHTPAQRTLLTYVSPRDVKKKNAPPLHKK
jgi:hypothetical protein